MKQFLAHELHNMAAYWVRVQMHILNIRIYAGDEISFLEEMPSFLTDQIPIILFIFTSFSTLFHVSFIEEEADYC